MRIAILHTHALYWMGGIKFIFEIAKRLKEICDVDIYVHQSGALAQHRFQEIGCPLTNLSHVSSYSKKYWLLFPYYLRDDVKALQKVANKYDVFLSTYFPMNWVATRLGKRAIYFCYEPFVWFHDPAALRNMSPFMKLLILGASPFYKHYDLEGARRSECVLTLSNFIASRIDNIYGVEAIVAGEGVDTQLFAKKHHPELEKRYKGNKIILHSTSYSYIKRTPSLIEALPLIKQEVPQVRLLIMSTYDDKQAKNRLIERARQLDVYENIEFLPFLEEEMLPYYYSLADVVAQPSFNEAASLPIKEAMACGTPVIGSYEDGSKEDIGNSECGFLIHSGDVNELAKYITILLRDEKLAARMGECGRQRVLETFSWDKVVDVIWQAISAEKNSKHLR